ncbi:hypothetical protein NLJ89_g913 [Agrocybe chaxingu]|uniref:Uncharacterized protein n=1 Tax=Agrocybe chaxingu TaxID=84603 RepID=A0A9W8N106_9AGAR|nr:hypothetical protein NLJ89_g913 [Agrocybe chaxingu]
MRSARTPKEPMAVTSSLNSIHISPRTPKTPRPNNMGDDEDDVELTLLNEEERNRSARNFPDDESSISEAEHDMKPAISAKDKRGMVLLPSARHPAGTGPRYNLRRSVPFLLKEHLSYSQLATFALSSYPYSLKLLWSPIVDSIFFKSFGRRKSWIVPMQIIVGSLMMYISFNVKRLMEDPAHNVIELTTVFTMLVTFSATQDIAVDGWALTLLSHDCLSYASTCQTIGLNTGFFASFTVFLAFNSEAFAAKWGVPHLTLAGYLRFWSIVCFVVTLWLIIFKKEDKEPANDADMSIKGVYKTIWTICQLRHVQLLVVVHLFAKVGFAANDAATGLKLVEKGFKREDLAIVVLIDFPFQIMGGWLAAKWSRGDRPLRPWIYAFWPRLVFALIAAFIVYFFPKPPIPMSFFVLLIIHTVLSSFASTVQFVGISAFHTRVSDPLIGGTYMTLLNTFTNMGATECVSDHGKAACKDIGGKCITHTDGYYTVTIICLAFGLIFLVAFIIPTARKLQRLPTSVWRVKMN